MALFILTKPLTLKIQFESFIFLAYLITPCKQSPVLALYGLLLSDFLFQLGLHFKEPCAVTGDILIFHPFQVKLMLQALHFQLQFCRYLLIKVVPI